MKMKRKQTCAQVGHRVVRGQGCCLLVVRSVNNKVMCPADGQQNEDIKGQTGGKARRGYM